MQDQGGVGETGAGKGLGRQRAGVSADLCHAPAALVIACEGAAALHLQHETGEVISRVNAFLGFNAIGRIRIVQKPLTMNEPPPRPRPRALTEGEKAKLASTVGQIEDDGLRVSLERLGATIIGSKKRSAS
jgi:hypothetical protein